MVNESEVIPMHTILNVDELREMTDYIEKISDAPDNTNSAELIEYAANLCREINEEKE